MDIKTSRSQTLFFMEAQERIFIIIHIDFLIYVLLFTILYTYSIRVSCTFHFNTRQHPFIHENMNIHVFSLETTHRYSYSKSILFAVNHLGEDWVSQESSCEWVRVVWVFYTSLYTLFSSHKWMRYIQLHTYSDCRSHA